MNRVPSKTLLVLILAALIGGGVFAWQRAHAPTEKPAEEIALQGLVGFTELEGGCWYVIADTERGDREQVELTGIGEDMLLQYRDKIADVRGQFRPDLVSLCQIGRIFEVEEITLADHPANEEDSAEDASGRQAYRGAIEFRFLP